MKLNNPTVQQINTVTTPDLQICLSNLHSLLQQKTMKMGEQQNYVPFWESHRGSRTRRNAVSAGLENKILAILPVIIRHFP